MYLLLTPLSSEITQSARAHKLCTRFNRTEDRRVNFPGLAINLGFLASFTASSLQSTDYRVHGVQTTNYSMLVLELELELEEGKSQPRV